MKDRLFEEGNLPSGEYYLVDKSPNKLDSIILKPHNDELNTLVIREGSGTKGDPFKFRGGSHMFSASIILYHLSELRSTPIWFNFQLHTYQVDAKSEEEPIKIADDKEIDEYDAKNLKSLLDLISEDRKLE